MKSQGFFARLFERKLNEESSEKEESLTQAEVRAVTSAASDAAAQVIAEAFAELKQRRTGDKERDKVTFKEIMARRLADMKSGKLPMGPASGAAKELAEVLNDYSANKTGDREANRACLRKLAERKQAEMRGRVEEAAADFRRHLRDIRASAPVWNANAERHLELPTSCDDELVQQHKSDAIDQTLFSWVKWQMPTVDVKQHIEDLVIIYEGEPLDALLNAWWCSTNDYQTREDAFVGPNALAAFSRLNDTKGSPLQLIFLKETGLKAAYYLPKTKMGGR